MNLCHHRGMGATANTHFRSEMGSGRGSPSAPRSVDLGLDHNSETPQTGPHLRTQPRSIAAESSVLELARATLPASTQDPPPPLELQTTSTTSSTSVCVRVRVSSNLLDAMRVPPLTLRVQVIINAPSVGRRLWRYNHWERPRKERQRVGSRLMIRPPEVTPGHPSHSREPWEIDRGEGIRGRRWGDS